MNESINYNYNNIFTEYPDIVSRKDLQKMLGIGSSTAFNLLNSNKIKSIRIGNTHKIPKINIINYLNLQALQNKSDMLQYASDTVGSIEGGYCND